MQIICQERNADELLKRFFDFSNDQYQPVQVNAQDRLGRTLLHVALSRGHINWVKFLLRNGADPNLANNDGLTPLHFLSKSEYGDKMAETFFKICDEKYQTLQINAQDKIGKTPLHYTLSNGCKKQILRVLLRKGADSNLADEEGLTPTHVVCKRNNDDELAELFFEINDDNQQIVQVNTQDKLGWTPLHYALANNGKNSIRALLRRGVSPNLVNAEGSTPLHIVNKRGKNSLVLAKILFEMCENRRQLVQVNVQDNLGNTPLHLSEAALNDDVSKLLLRKDADPNVVNKEGLTPLHIICDESHDFGLAKTFFKINDDRKQLVQVNAKDNLGRTSLQLAVANLLTDVVDLLLDHGANLSSFFFPPASSFGLGLEIRLEKSINLKQVSSALVIIERLERRGYELDQTDALTMIKFFTKYEVFEKSTNLVKSWCKNKGFAREAKKVKIRPELSLCDLFLLRPEEAKKLVTYTEYFKLANSAAWWDIPEASIQPCVLNLCEKQLRRFFRHWALEFFLILIRNRLPIEFCDMILDEESFTNKDLYHICLAATGQS
ncbi:hypothetical protein TKK_0008983 [Trichogramma kaykai]|uniref:Uncharacterized protein n=1 Tax=Trichogramma kaykai TaxID=54128 RepID=A0ABD2X2W7_9HYME